MARIHEYLHHHILSLDDRGEGQTLKEEILLYLHDRARGGAGGAREA